MIFGGLYRSKKRSRVNYKGHSVLLFSWQIIQEYQPRNKSQVQVAPDVVHLRTASVSESHWFLFFFFIPRTRVALFRINEENALKKNTQNLNICKNIYNTYSVLEEGKAGNA